jgi:GAF domain-containing protein
MSTAVPAFCRSAESDCVRCDLMSETEEFASILSRLLNKAAVILNARAVLLALMRPDGTNLCTRVALGLEPEQLEEIDRERLRQFSQLALTAGLPTRLNSAVECRNALGEAVGSCILNGLCVPLLARARQEKNGVEPVAALLFLFNKARDRSFSDEDSNLAALLGRQIAAVLFEQHRREAIL